MILTVATEDGLRERVARSLDGTEWATTVANVSTVGEANALLVGATPPRAVVVGEDLGVDRAADIAAVASTLRSAPLVLLVGVPTTEVLRAAMRAGIRDVLPGDFGAEELITTLRDAGVRGGGPSSLPGLTVAVFSTKGGVGTSVVASNLAVVLGDRIEGGAVLLDLDLPSADQAIMHGLAPKWTIQDVAEGGVGLDAESLTQVLLPVSGSKSRLLPGPIDPALAETITPSDVSAVIAAVRAQERIAVLDTSSGFDDRTLAALDAADAIVVVCSLDVAALRSLTVSLQTMERLGVDAGSIVIALARADSKSGLLASDIEHAIDRPIDIGIPSMRHVPRSVNAGVPLAVSAPRNAVVSAMHELADLLMDRIPDAALRAEDDSAGGGLFSWSRWTNSKSETDVEELPGVGDDRDSPDDASANARGVESDAEEETSAAPPPPRGNVRSLRRTSSGTEEEAGVRAVRRRVLESSVGDQPALNAQAGEPTGQDRVDSGADESTSGPRALDELPPPVAAADDDDDLPRRRRRR